MFFEDNKSTRLRVHPRPCLWQGTAENRWWNQYSIPEDNQSIGTRSPPSAVSLAGDSREPMVNHYSSEDNQAIKIPRPPSAVSLGGDSREPMVNQYSSEDNQAIKIPSPPSALSLGGDSREPMGKPLFFGG